MARPNKKKLSRNEIEEAQLSQMNEYVANIRDTQKRNVLETIKIDIKCKTENQKKLVKELRDKEVVVCAGLPGTGKTYLACAVALELLKKNPKYKKIYIIKSVTTLKDEDIGYLKGNLKDKMEPFMFSFMHNFEKIVGAEVVGFMRASGIIQELPIAYMRGINIDNAIAIIDEAQNISVENIRTIMTRLGTDSKFFFLGDTEQVDMKKKEDSSLQFILEYFDDMEEMGTVMLGEDDVVRNPFIKKINARFNEALEKEEQKKLDAKTAKKAKPSPFTNVPPPAVI